jgi:hypothetical protein
VFDAEALTPLAVEAGLDEAEVREMLAGDAYADAVAADMREARALGVSGVPFFVIDRRFGVSGAQATDVFAQTLARARSHRAASEQTSFPRRSRPRPGGSGGGAAGTAQNAQPAPAANSRGLIWRWNATAGSAGWSDRCTSSPRRHRCQRPSTRRFDRGPGRGDQPRGAEGPRQRATARQGHVSARDTLQSQVSKEIFEKIAKRAEQAGLPIERLRGSSRGWSR